MNPQEISLSVIETIDGQIFYDFSSLDMISPLFVSNYGSLPDHVVCSFKTEPNDLISLSGCSLVVESDRPKWFDENRYNHLHSILRDYMASLIIREDKPLLIKQYAIISGRAKIQKAVECHIIAMFDFSEILEIEHCEAWHVYDNSKIFNSLESDIIFMNDSSNIVFSKYNTRILYMKDRSSIHDAQFNTSVVHMTDFSRVDRLSYHSVIHLMYKNSYVDEATTESSIILMDEDSHVNIMTNKASVKVMKGNSKVLSMYHDTLVINKEANCEVSSMHHNAKIINIF